MDFMGTIKKAVPFGIAGAVAVAAYTYLAGFMQLPHPDYHGMIGSFFHTGMAGSWLVYFGAGVFLAFLYAMFATHLPSTSWKKGILFGLIIWGFTQFVMMPVFGMGFFSGSMMAAFGMLLGDAFYGAIIGYLYAHSH